MYKFLFFTILVSFLPSSLVLGAVNPKMKQNAEEMAALIPLLNSKEDFLDKKNSVKINRGIDHLLENFESIEGHFAKMPSQFLISQKVTKEFLLEAKDALAKVGPTNYTFRMLRNLPGLCIHCHTYDNKRSFFSNSITREQFANDLSYAEFNYFTRNYKKSLEYYLKWSQEGHKADSENEEQVVKQILGLYILGLDDPKGAIDFLKKYSLNKDIDYFLKSDLKIWLDRLVDAEKNKKLISLSLKDGHLIKDLHKYFGDLEEEGPILVEENDRIKSLILLKKLNNYIEKRDLKNDLPVALYWMSLLERKLYFNLYYSFSDLYLKECMKNHTKHAFAKKCFVEFKNQITLSYSGSGGIQIPNSVRKDLEFFRNLVYNTKNKKK